MTELSILLSFVCMIMLGVMFVMFTAWAVCVVGGRDDERAGRDYVE